VFLAGFVGLLLSDSAILAVFGIGEPSLGFYLLSGLAWNSILESLITKFGCGKSSKKNGGNPKKPGNPGTSLGAAGRSSIVGCYTPILAVHARHV